MVTSDPTSIALQLFEAKISGGGVTPFERQCIFQRKGKSDIHKMSGSRLTELKPVLRRGEGGEVVMWLPEVSRTEETVRRPVDVLAADWPLAPGLMPAPRPPGPAPAPPPHFQPHSGGKCRDRGPLLCSGQPPATLGVEYKRDGPQ